MPQSKIFTVYSFKLGLKSMKNELDIAPPKLQYIHVYMNGEIAITLHIFVIFSSHSTAVLFLKLKQHNDRYLNCNLT